ncbi:MAG: hypothetical protein Q4G69_11635 [Planctomycetia bacterium]|nr:hypothetical protein [Planctomycetia bacterium]
MVNSEYLFDSPKNPFLRTDDRRTCSFEKFAAYTLLEILISVTLMLMLMYGVAAIFSRVGGIMNSTQSTMEMSNNLRNAKNRLENDLKGITAPLTPPLNSTSNTGYFCYIEGLGTSYFNYQANYKPAFNALYSPPASAWDEDRAQPDNTVGDVDDILMFTAKAPAGKFFRGRLGKNNIVESEYAEIIWFLRGTTLYRRVLLIIPDAELQEALDSVSYAYFDKDGNTQTASKDKIKQGYGFFQFFDVSVHLKDGEVVANTLSDLSNRANRYGFWQSMVVDSGLAFIPHGAEGAWYWLRMPTMQESAICISGDADLSFRAGTPFGGDKVYVDNLPEWFGSKQILRTPKQDQLPDKPEHSNVLPHKNDPPIDYWNMPNSWVQVDPESGDLLASEVNTTSRFSQDVLLTNVIGFDVKAWDDTMNKFVNLGECVQNQDKSSLSFRSLGNYSDYVPIYPKVRVEGDDKVPPYMPAVFDTWTEQYELDYLQDKASKRDGFTAENIPLNGKITTAHLPDYPPPYDIPLKAIQIELRAFDPRSGNIRNMTLNVDFTSL